MYACGLKGRFPVHHGLRHGFLIVSLLGSALALPACGDDDADDMGGMAGTGNETSCSSEMFDKYGETAFVAVRDSIVTKALAAPTDKLGDAFEVFARDASAAEIQNFKDNLASFLVMVYGGPSNYGGRSMEQAHAGLNITSDQYDYFVTEIIVPALAENGVPADDISMCFAPPVVDPAFKASIVGR